IKQFRRYLEKNGVLDSLTTVLVALYEETEKPSNALDLLQQSVRRVSRLEPEKHPVCCGLGEASIYRNQRPRTGHLLNMHYISVCFSPNPVTHTHTPEHLEYATRFTWDHSVILMHLFF
uniref:Uncharacterized protein n=1 Tax=Cyprinus carpio TaxID=7962 RepID=A0A8C2GPG4_CYPCA